MYRRARWIVMAMALLGAAAPASAEPVAAPPVCALVSTAPATALLSVPFRVIDGRIYVDARVNGEGPFIFAVDTGASGMGRADARLVTRLDLPQHGRSTTSDGVAMAGVDTVRLAAVELGGFTRTDIEVITRDYAARMDPDAAFDGILGREFFGDGLLIIDYPARRLSFTRSERLPREAKDVLGYERAFRVPVTIGAMTAEANLDTGANIAFVLPKTLFDRIGGGPVEAARQGQLTNSKIDTARATVRGPIRIGAATLSDVEVRVSERFPEMLVGAHALQHFALLIDQRTQAVALCPPPADTKAG